MVATKRRINFIHDSAYWQLLADISAYLEEREYEYDEDFIWQDSGHTLVLDQDANFDLKEIPEWEALIEGYEKVGDLCVRRLR